MDDKVYVFEGKTSTEAIENGLKELKVSKNKVDIKILEQEDKRSFFSILTPRVVKVEMRIKENGEEPKKAEREEIKKEPRNSEPVDNTENIKSIKRFLDEFISKLPNNNLKYDVLEEDIPNNYKVSYLSTDEGFTITNTLIEEPEEPDKPNHHNPQTLDNINLYLITILLSILGFTLGNILLKKKTN